MAPHCITDLHWGSVMDAVTSWNLHAHVPLVDWMEVMTDNRGNYRLSPPYWLIWTLLKQPKMKKWRGLWFNIKMSSYWYRKSNCGDKMVVRSSYLHNGISYTGKMTSSYWISPQVIADVTEPIRKLWWFWECWLCMVGDLVMPYDDIVLGEHWLSATRQQAITWTNVNLSVRYSDIHLSLISWKIPQSSIMKNNLKITCHATLTGANEFRGISGMKSQRVLRNIINEALP